MKNTIYIFCAALLTISCSVGFSIDEPQKFSCESKDDCESGYVCNKANVCIVEVGGVAKCADFDADGDGYGVGKERIACELCQNTAPNGEGCIEDPDDTNDQVSPGAPEICDNIDNDGDGTVDNTETPIGFEPTVPADGELPTPKIKCASTNDCPPANQQGVQVFCDAEKCVARMSISLGFPECNANNLICTNGAYPAVPENCGGPAPQ